MIREINESKEKTSSKAIDFLTDELYDDEKCFRAIKLHIIKRFSNKLTKQNDFENLNNICLGLKIIATHLQGAEKIIEENIIIKKIYNLINDDNIILKKSSADVLLRLASHFESKFQKLKKLSKNNFILNSFRKDDRKESFNSN